MPFISAVSTLKTATGTALTTLAVSPTTVGNCQVLSVKIVSSTIHVSTVTGGGSTWVKVAGPVQDTEATVHTHELWLGTVTSTGASNITLTYSASITGIGTDLSSQEFTAGNTSTTWAADGTGSFVNNAASTTVKWPSVAPGHVGELYVGHARCPSGSSYSAVTAGYTVVVDADSNPYIYGFLPVSGATGQPQATTASTISNALGTVIKATVPYTISPLSAAPAYASGTAMASFSLTSKNVGDIFFGFIEIDPSTAVKTTALSSSNATWSNVAQIFASDGKNYELWIGYITAASTATVSMTFSGSVTGLAVETGFQEFASSRTGPVWCVDTANVRAYTTGTSILYPTLFGRGSNELYWGYGKTTATGSVGSSSGYSYNVTPQVNVVCWNWQVSGSQSPTAVTTSGSGESIAAIISDVPLTPGTFAFF